VGLSVRREFGANKTSWRPSAINHWRPTAMSAVAANTVATARRGSLTTRHRESLTSAKDEHNGIRACLGLEEVLATSDLCLPRGRFVPLRPPRYG
jgi:hypothetical protein